MDQKERDALKESLKNRFRPSLRSDVDTVERALAAQGMARSRLEIVRALRAKMVKEVRELQAQRAPAERVSDEEIEIRLKAYHEIMDEIVRDASN